MGCNDTYLYTFGNDGKERCGIMCSPNGWSMNWGGVCEILCEWIVRFVFYSFSFFSLSLIMNTFGNATIHWKSLEHLLYFYLFE
jgi:hypothetical protein